MMAVTITHPQGPIGVVVSHTPHSWSPESVIYERRKRFTALAQNHVRDSDRLICLFDASAKVGSIQSEHIGGFEPFGEDAAGECLHIFLQEMSGITVNFLEHKFHGRVWPTQN
jgi:NAD-dependent oxidoreductase involved in siderophore biosynthesis